MPLCSGMKLLHSWVSPLLRNSSSSLPPWTREWLRTDFASGAMASRRSSISSALAPFLGSPLRRGRKLGWMPISNSGLSRRRASNGVSWVTNQVAGTSAASTRSIEAATTSSCAQSTSKVRNIRFQLAGSPGLALLTVANSPRRAMSVDGGKPLLHVEERPDEEPTILLPREVLVYQSLDRPAIEEAVDARFLAKQR